jgi:hypothetical protein
MCLRENNICTKKPPSKGHSKEVLTQYNIKTYLMKMG